MCEIRALDGAVSNSGFNDIKYCGDFFNFFAHLLEFPS